MTPRPGPLNLITDVDGILVGNAHNANVKTGVTALMMPGRAVAAVDMRGGAPGTRETDALNPAGLNVGIDAIVLSGGSVYGLEAASAVTNWLGAQGRGVKLLNSPLVAPVIPAAILFDLANGGDKSWGETPPYGPLGRAAAAAAPSKTFALGKAGAGFGARAGAYEGGLGSASFVTPEGWQIGALVAVNPFGSPYMPGTKTLWAWPWECDGEMGVQTPPAQKPLPHVLPPDTKMGSQANQNTTLAIVATNVALTAAQAQRLAIMAQDGMARAISPIHTPFDGDVVFAVSTSKVALPEPWPLSVTKLGSLAADCLARAIGRAVWEANKR
jgi:L-aminopeptidase/D-esterase-like protein